MTAVVDRIEENIVVCETPDEQTFSLPLNIIPDACEGYHFSVEVCAEEGFPVTDTDEDWLYITAMDSIIKIPSGLCPTAQSGNSITFASKPEEQQQRHQRILDLMDDLFE